MPVFIANKLPDSQGAVLSLLVEMLVSAGWTYKASGDGQSGYSSTGKIFTNSGSGALGWDNFQAWARLADPSNRREFVFYRNGTETVRIKYSRLAKFTGGTPSATTMPTATDERYLAGSASTASASWLASSVTPYRTSVFFGMAQTSAPYGFWFAGGDAYRGWLRTALIVDPVKGVSADPDPYVNIFCGPGLSGMALSYRFWAPDLSNPSIADYSGNIPSTDFFPYATMDAAGNIYRPVAASSYYGGPLDTLSGALAVNYTGGTYNPFDSGLDAFPLLYQRPHSPFQGTSVNTGIKGWSTLCHWTNGPRLCWDTANNRTLICVGSVWLPWDGVTIPLGG